MLRQIMPYLKIISSIIMVEKRMNIISGCRCRKVSYTEYEVGDTITAYTTDHIKYSYNKAGILPDKKYRNNELMKVAGVLLGAAIGFLSLWGLLNRKIN